MTIKEAENFYKQDKKEYIMTNNNILKWLNEELENEDIKKYLKNNKKTFKNALVYVHKSLKDNKDLQELIDYLTIWFEIKYPDKEMDTNNGTTYLAYENIKPISHHMDINQLLYRLKDEHEDIISCYYRAHSWSATPVIINHKIINDSSIHITLKVKNEINNLNNDYFISLNIDYITGLLPINSWMKFHLGNCINEKDLKNGYIHIEDLVEALEKNDSINYNELLETVLDKKFREKIRKEILELVSLKLLYSRNTIPEYGYERAKRFINEMNKKLNANLSTNRIDEIMSKDYKDVKKLIK